MSEKMVSIEALKSFLRRESSNLLKEENVTSVGVGYKITGGVRTEELSIQFTVGQKVAPEQLESIGAKELPKFFIIEGTKVPTDVEQRKFETDAKEVKIESRLEAASARKSVSDPVVPGISIGHPSISAGTAGCVVYDSETGAPYVLSNWHVLNGPSGKIGDEIVQPGRHDDNRIERNIVGRLVRSHLGIAGDCAVTTIENRRLDPVILGLNVAIERIGEPELGDRVVKSGRTTDVTYGIVNRVHTTVKIDYEGAVGKEIGCFEIVPDPDHPAENGEISMGGDSGSAWLNVAGGKPSNMILGLHFAGEVGDSPEHALACYATSVFEKLSIQPTKAAKPARLEKVKLGYAPNFIGKPLPMPIAATVDTSDDLLVVDGNSVVNYTHFSLAMSRSRRFARWVAWNIDGGSLRRLSRKSISFKKDPKLPSDAQVGNELYANNQLDRGHIARRADVVWGTLAEARQANIDSFFYTNITPQHQAFNQSDANGIWGELENAIFADVDVADLRVSVYGGPILSANDPVYRDVRLPKEFWKVVYFRESGDETIRAKGFVLTQADLLNQLEILELPEFAVFEVPVTQIGEMSGLVLPGEPATVEHAVRRGREKESVQLGEGRIRRISSINDIL